MKKINNYILLLFSAILLNGCVDLDTYPQGNYVTEEQKSETAALDPSKVEAGVNGVFTQFSTYMTVITEASRHNDFGYGSVMLMLDSNGNDVVAFNDGYNWFSGGLEYDDRVYTSYEVRIIWGTLYKQIYAANNVIATVDPETTEETSMFYLAQGLATRAYDYWVLAQLYQFNYVGNESKPCVPLITDKNAVTAGTEGCARSTVGETYELIMSDLNAAITLLEGTSVTPKDKRYISLATAYGLRARVNLTMQKWGEAAADAAKAIEHHSGKPYSMSDVSVPAFINSADASWMWGIVIAETDRVVTSGIVNFPSHMGSLSYGYANFSKGRQINKILYKSIPDSDVRKGWWLDENSASPNLNADMAKEVANNAYPPYTQVKYAPYNNVAHNSTNASDIPLMRVEEMYLIKAEGEAMGGNVAAAKATLESLIIGYRDPDYTCTATSVSEMQEEIFRQRRIELWGEGLNWFDVMRLSKGVDRRGAGYHNPTVVFKIEPTDPILLYRIPEKEIQSNSLIAEEDNNPAAPIPTPVADYE
ncbi:RagB/SusD family nutrient uptake outer membrane protein [Parabacteroides sp. OttesenSCG-928-N08]|nr:RagB/SusD family nutrient uptake outer membrane protein [Parabacteroides sp. OttesenSCG-928-N08]